jgi:hypothetical protein
VDLQAKKDVDLLLFDGGLIMNMRILGPKGRSDGSVPRSALPGYEKALKLPYLIVARPVSFVRPTAVNRETYTPGNADLEAFVVDLRTDKVVASCRIKAASADRTTAVFRKHEGEKQSVEAAAYSTLWEDAHAKLADALKEITGGTFVFRRY